MLKRIEVYSQEVILRDEDGVIIERIATDNPELEDRRGMPF